MIMKSILLLNISVLLASLINAQTIPKSIDKTPVSKAQMKVVVKRPGTVEKNKDSDGDGLIDTIDECPLVKGTPKNSGCPPSVLKLPEMIHLKGGTFNMGEKWVGNAYPIHQVTVSGFYIGKYEVTQKEWSEIMGSNPSEFKNCLDCPVENISWEDVQLFLEKLNRLSGKNYRLPTEAEWEFAAIGDPEKGYYGLSHVAWYEKNGEGKTHPVGGKTSNSYGIYDMCGNVWEWCSDWYEKYKDAAQTNPRGAITGTGRAIRGGCFNSGAFVADENSRAARSPEARNGEIGFRLAFSE